MEPLDKHETSDEGMSFDTGAAIISEQISLTGVPMLANAPLRGH